MIAEPVDKRVFAFVDGQNLFYGAKEAFGYTFPNYDVERLCSAICRQNNWQLTRIHFYTGIPDPGDDPFWHHFWVAKLSAMGRTGVRIFSRPLRYHNQTVHLPDGSTHTFLVGQEKGVDIRIALDIVRAVRERVCDVVLVFSQDQDLSEVADEIRIIAKEQDRWIKMASAFCYSPTSQNRRGVNKTDWLKIERVLYDACIDPKDYRSPIWQAK